MFIAALFPITKIWNPQPKSPSIDKWTKKMCCVCVCGSAMTKKTSYH